MITPAPKLADPVRRRPFALLWPVVALALILLYNAIYSQNFFQIKILYTHTQFHALEPIELHQYPMSDSPVIANLMPGSAIATLVGSQLETDPAKWNEVTISDMEGGKHAYLPASAKTTIFRSGGYLYGSLIDVFHNGARVMMLALGMALVIATGGIDLSVGSVMAIAGCVAASLVIPEHTIFESWHPAPTLLLVISFALLAGLLAGAFNGLLVSVFNIQPIIATLILMICGRGIADLITGGFKPAYLETANPSLNFIGNGHLLGIPFPMFIVLGFTILTLLLTRATALGLFIESIGNNPAAANVAGIHANFVKFLVYTFAGLCAAVAGIIQTTDVREAAPYNEGLYMELDAIVAVAIGGTSLIGGRFSIVGSLMGALIMQALRTTILLSRMPSEFTLVVQAAVVLIICLLQSESFRAIITRPFKNAAIGRGAA